MSATDFRYQVKLNKIPVVGLVPESSSSAPGSPVDGQLWWDTTNSLLKWSSGGSWKDPLARANHTGTQTASTISNLAATVQAYRLDQFAAPNIALDHGGQRASNAADPTTATDLATKQYVDNARAGVQVKDPVRVVATSNINLASLPSAIDGVTLSSTGGPDGLGDRFLVTAQTTGTQNGLYRYTGSGAAASRTSDADTTGEVVDGTLVAVAEGTAAGSQYIQTATPSGAPGAWTQTWVAFNTGGTTYNAGNGLQLATTTFSVKVDPAGPVTTSGSGVSLSTVPIAFGGTGATSAGAARTALGTVGKYAANLGAITGGTPLTITHNLGTTDILEPSLKDTATGELVGAQFIVVDSNSVTVTVAVSASSGAYRVTVIG